MSPALAARAAAEPKPLPVAGITTLDIAHARANGGAGIKDWRRMEVGRLYVECLRFARTKRSEAKGFRKSETDSIAADMVVRIAERITKETAHLTDARKRNASTPLRFGPPLKRGPDEIMRWSEVAFLFRADDGRTLLTADGWRLLTAAMSAVLVNPRSWREGSELVMVDGAPVPREMPTDPFAEGMSVASRALLEREAAEGSTALMVDASAEELARALGVRADEARAISGASVMHRSKNGRMVLGHGAAAICAREWNVSTGKAAVSVSKGAKLLRARYGTGRELLSALENAHTALVEIAADALSLAVDETRAGYALAHRSDIGARCACLRCTASRYAGMRTEARAAEVASLAHLARNACPSRTGGWVVERAPQDALRPYARDGLMVGVLGHAARTARERYWRAAGIAANAHRARARRDALPYVPTVGGAPYGELLNPSGAHVYPDAWTTLTDWLRTLPMPIGHPARLQVERTPMGMGIMVGCPCPHCVHGRMTRDAR